MSCWTSLFLFSLVFSTARWTSQGVPFRGASEDGINSCPSCTEDIQESFLDYACHHSMVRADVVTSTSQDSPGKLSHVEDILNSHEINEFVYFSISPTCSCSLLKEGSKLFILGPLAFWQNDRTDESVAFNQDFIIISATEKTVSKLLPVIHRCKESSLKSEQQNKTESTSQDPLTENLEEQLLNDEPLDHVQQRVNLDSAFSQRKEALQGGGALKAIQEKQPIAFASPQIPVQQPQTLPPLVPGHIVASYQTEPLAYSQPRNILYPASPEPVQPVPRLVYRSPIIYLNRILETQTLPDYPQYSSAPGTPCTKDVPSLLPVYEGHAPPPASAPLSLYPAPAPLPVYQAPAPLPVYQAPAPLPVYQAPAPLPVYQAPAPLPVYQAPAPLPVYQSPAPLPVYQSCAPLPVYQSPAPLPVYQAPAPLPVYQSRAPLPLYQSRAPLPLYQSPAPLPVYQIRDRLPAPVYQARTTLPVYQTPGPVPVYQARSSLPVYYQSATPLPQVIQTRGPISPVVQSPTPLSPIIQTRTVIPSIVYQKANSLPSPLFETTSRVFPPTVQKSVPLSSVVQTPVPLSSVVQTPVSLSPVVQAPVPLSPVVQVPVPLSPVVQVPVPISPMVQAPVPLSPVGQAPVPLSPVVQAPVPLSPVVQAPVPLSSVVQAPVPLSPVVQAPVPLSPVVQAPVPLSPVVQAPVPLSPVVQTPVPLSPMVQTPVPLSPMVQTAVPLSPVVQTAVPLSPAFQPRAPLSPVVYERASQFSVAQERTPLSPIIQVPAPFPSPVHQIRVPVPLYQKAVPLHENNPLSPSDEVQKKIPDGLNKAYERMSVGSRVPLYYSPVYSETGSVYRSPVVYINRTYELQQKILVPVYKRTEALERVNPVYQSAPIHNGRNEATKTIEIEQQVQESPYPRTTTRMLDNIPKQVSDPFPGRPSISLEIPKSPEAHSQREITILPYQPKIYDRSEPFYQPTDHSQYGVPVPGLIIPGPPMFHPHPSVYVPPPFMMSDQAVSGDKEEEKESTGVPNDKDIVKDVRQESTDSSDITKSTNKITEHGEAENGKRPLPVTSLPKSVQTFQAIPDSQTLKSAPAAEFLEPAQSSQPVQPASSLQSPLTSDDHVRSKRNTEAKPPTDKEQKSGTTVKDDEQPVTAKGNQTRARMLANANFRYETPAEVQNDYNALPVPTTDLDNPLYEQALIAPSLPSLKYSYPPYSGQVDVSICQDNYECPECVEDIEGALREKLCSFDYILVVDIQAESRIYSVGGDYGVSCNVMDVADYIIGDHHHVIGSLVFKRNDICKCSFVKRFVGPFMILAKQDSFSPAGGPFTSITLDRSVHLVRYAFRNLLATIFTLDKCGKLPPLKQPAYNHPYPGVPISDKLVYGNSQYSDLSRVYRAYHQPKVPPSSFQQVPVPMGSISQRPLPQPPVAVYEKPSTAAGFVRKGACPSDTAPSCPKCVLDIYDPTFQALYCTAAAAYIVNHGLVQVPDGSIAEKTYETPGPYQPPRTCYIYLFNYMANLKSLTQEQIPTGNVDGYLESSCSCRPLSYPGSLLLLSLRAGTFYGRNLYLSKDHVLVSLSPGPVRLPTCQQTVTPNPNPGQYPVPYYPPKPVPTIPCPSVMLNSCPHCAPAVTQDTLELFCEAPFVAVAQSLSSGNSAGCTVGSLLMRQEVFRAHGIKGGAVPVGTELQYFLKSGCQCPHLYSGTGYVLMISTRVMNRGPVQLTNEQVIISLEYGRTSLPACIASTVQEKVITYKHKADQPIHQTRFPTATNPGTSPVNYPPIRFYQTPTVFNYTRPNVYSPSPPTIQSVENPNPRPAPQRPSFERPAAAQPPSVYGTQERAPYFPYVVVNQTQAPFYPAPSQQVRFPRYDLPQVVPENPLTRDGRSPYYLPYVSNETFYHPPRYVSVSNRPPVFISNCPSAPHTCSQVLSTVAQDLKQSICSYPNVLLLEVRSVGGLGDFGHVPCGIARLVKAIRGHPSLYSDTIHFSFLNNCNYNFLVPGSRIYILSKEPTTYGKRLKNLILDSETVVLSHDRHIDQELLPVLSTCHEKRGSGLEICPLHDGNCPLCFAQPPENYKDTFCKAQHALVVAIGLDYEAMKKSPNSSDLIFMKQPGVEHYITNHPDENTFTSIYVKQNIGGHQESSVGQCLRERVRILYDVTYNTRSSAYSKDVTSYVPAECDCNFLQSGPGYGLIMSLGKPLLASTSDILQLTSGYTTFPLPLGTLTLPSCIPENNDASGTFFRFSKEVPLGRSHISLPPPPSPQLPGMKENSIRYGDCGYRPVPTCPRCYPYFTQETLNDFCGAEYAYLVTAMTDASPGYRYNPQLTVITSLDYTKLTVQGSNIVATTEMEDTSYHRSKRGIEHFCPAGFLYSSCAPPPGCEPTCESPHSVQCYSRICKPGCVCPHGTVRQGNLCVSPHQCVHPNNLNRCLFGVVHVVETIKKPEKNYYPASDPHSYMVQGYCSCPYLEYPQGSALIFSNYPLQNGAQLTHDAHVVILPYGTTQIPECGKEFYVRAPVSHTVQPTVPTSRPSESVNKLGEEKNRFPPSSQDNSLVGKEEERFIVKPVSEELDHSPENEETTAVPEISCPDLKGCPACISYNFNKLDDIFCKSTQAIIVAVGLMYQYGEPFFKLPDIPEYEFEDVDPSDEITQMEINIKVSEGVRNSHLIGAGKSCYQTSGTILHDVTGKEDPKTYNKTVEILMSDECNCPHLFGVTGYVLILSMKKIPMDENALLIQDGYTVIALPYGSIQMPECKSGWTWSGPENIMLPASGPPSEPLDGSSRCPADTKLSCPKCYPDLTKEISATLCEKYVSFIFPEEPKTFTRYGSPQISVSKATINQKHRYQFMVATEGTKKQDLYSSAFVADKGICPKGDVQITPYCFSKSPFQDTDDLCEPGFITATKAKLPQRSKYPNYFPYVIRQECLCPYLESPHGCALLISSDRPFGLDTEPYQLTEDDTIVSLPFGKTTLPYCEPLLLNDESEQCPEVKDTCSLYEKSEVEPAMKKYICNNEYVLEVEVIQSPCTKDKSSSCGVGQLVRALKGLRGHFGEEIYFSVNQKKCSCDFNKGSKLFLVNSASSWIKVKGSKQFNELALDENTHIFDFNIEDKVKDVVDGCI